MDIRGFSGGEKSEKARLESNLEISLAAEQGANGIEDFVKGGIYLTGEVVETTGEVIEVAGIVTAQPKVAVVGGLMSNAGVAIQTAVDISDGKDVTESILGAGVQMVVGKTGDEVIKQAKKGAGGELDKITESILMGTTKVSQEIIDKMIAPVFGPEPDPNGNN